jgi:hypothetical protein
MINNHENISDIRKSISKINSKLNKMKSQSEDILSKDDADDFFKHFLELCTSKDTLSKTNVQQTFFDKIKNWYKKFIGENRNINLDEFKFINEEAKVLTESICNKEDYETIKNIFSTWKKGFNYNFKNKFSVDIDFIQTELKSIESMLFQLDKKSHLTKLTQEPSMPPKVEFPSSLKKPDISSILAKPKTIPISDKPETISVSDKPEAIPVSNKPETISVSDKPETIPVLKTTNVHSVEKNISNLTSALENLGFSNNEKLQSAIKKVIDFKKTKELVYLINAQDKNDIKLFLGL